jgi:hypothetical protein
MKTKSKKCDRIGLVSSSTNLDKCVSGKLRGTGHAEHETPDGGMLLEPTVKYPWAHDDFTRVELDERLERLRLLALQELPLTLVPSPR